LTVTVRKFQFLTVKRLATASPVRMAAIHFHTVPRN